MRNARLALIGVLGLASCATLNQPTDVTYSERLAEINAAYESAQVTGATPWVCEKLEDPSFLAGFERGTCGLRPGSRRRTPAALARCHSKLRDLFEARIAQQYPRINLNDLQIQCDTSPDACRNFRTYEGWARSSQNETLENEREDRITSLNRWRSEQEAKAQRRAEEMAGVSGNDAAAPDQRQVQDSPRSPAGTTDTQASSARKCSASSRHYNWWTAFCIP